MNTKYKINPPANETIKSYVIGTPERVELKIALDKLYHSQKDIPLIIDGKEIFTNITEECIIPHEKGHVLARYHKATEKELKMAIDASLKAKERWEATSWYQRAAIFNKAANLISGKYRALLNAATMLGQSKTAYQAEIDSSCELIDFLRFNTHFMGEIYNVQPDSTVDAWNRLEYRPLEGFVLAISPFNFTAIGGNLCTAPAMMGNTVVWKPASTAVYSNYIFMKILMEAGIPDGVINFVPSSGSLISEVCVESKDLAGIHFTGSTNVFQNLWKKVSDNISTYKTYPRLVGETGGKDFIFADNTANIDELSTGIIRGAFEYQGQKCSAASRAYIPNSIWPSLREKLIDAVSKIKMGNVSEFDTFVGAVIDESSYTKNMKYINRAHSSSDAEVIAGGSGTDKVGYFVQPTIIQALKPDYETMTEELFGPVITIYVYEDEALDETLDLCDTTSVYGLTGAIFSNNRYNIEHMLYKLRNSAGNFYINDKPTGAVVGQQPFGGARASGTNDKAGSHLNLLRWVSPRTIKENLYPPTSFEYPYMSNHQAEKAKSSGKSDLGLDFMSL
ncbi:L-glutamate gamma-semialdehyde dehydrogenase [Clostridium hydrogeniformans]|uniref:L-glutamate gamma-semialdehyde dehydrogenase n=1 Tax=Clostridium hydrogeniformans TaxID=349933 RepID=UPI000A06B7F9|nr:L-glutamate gamma-semialdehyde dehydrogenase [Clostridium hydrogeniformans]